MTDSDTVYTDPATGRPLFRGPFPYGLSASPTYECLACAGPYRAVYLRPSERDGHATRHALQGVKGEPDTL